MTTVRIGIGVTSVQAAKPTYPYGSNLQQAPLDSGAALALFHVNVASIPKNATITSAKVWFNQYDGPWSGSNTLTLLRHLAAFTYKVTWATKPAATTSASQTKSGSASATWWNINVTDDVQAFVAGTQTNFGWRLATSSTTLHKIRTHKAAASQPYLEVTYTIPSKVPTNLSPQGGAVSVGAPVLTFSVDDGTVSIQVQVDPAADGGSPAFDSGEVAATAGVLDLSATAYTGLADGDTTYWRARSKSTSGWSGWSTWVDFSRADLAALSLTSPTTTPADGSPPFEWTFAGTQTVYEATLLDANDRVLDTSGRVAGTDTGWTPLKGLKANGAVGRARIRVWDDVDRISTSGAPTYAEDDVDFTVTLLGTVPPMSTLVASQVTSSPGVVLTGTRASGGIPDEVIVFRDGVQVDRFPGTDIFTSPTAFSFTDWSAPMNVATTYRLAPVVNAEVASGGPTVTVTPKCDGIWLIDPATDLAVVLWGRDTGSWDAADLAVVHQPIAVTAGVVRRRLRRGILSGGLSGEVIDGKGFTAETTLANLDIFADNDAGTVYRLIAGHLNTLVIAGDFLVTPTPENSARNTWAKASFNFWSA